MRYAYLHGFASGPKSRKGQRLAEVFRAEGRALALPDLNAPSFAKLSLGAMLERLDTLDDGGPPWRFIGSSLGGWLAAAWAARRPERVDRLLLLCPAFDLVERWKTILPDGAMERWAADGALEVPDGAGVPTALHYAFYEEAAAHPAFPTVRCPTRVVHGTEDTQVPVEGSRSWAAAHPNVTLTEVRDGHDLLASMEVIERLALGWLSE